MGNDRNTILKLSNSRKSRVNNSVGVYDAYKWIRKNKWLDIGQPISEHDFYTVIRTVNKYLVECASKGDDIVLPCRMGRLELRKFNSWIKLDDNKIRTNLPVDWDRTIKLWIEDEEAHSKKTLVRMEEKEIFKVFYNKKTANFVNKGFYSFRINRELKRKLKYNIKCGIVDAFTI